MSRAFFSSLSFPTHGSRPGWFGGRREGLGELWPPRKLSPSLYKRLFVSTSSQCPGQTSTPGGPAREAETRGLGHCDIPTARTRHTCGQNSTLRGRSSRPGSGCPREKGASGRATAPEAGKVSTCGLRCPLLPGMAPSQGWGDAAPPPPLRFTGIDSLCVN